MKKLLIILLLFSSCATKKNIQTSVTKVTDTVYIKTETIKSPNISEAITIKELCKDSVPVQFKKVFVIKNDTITVETQNNELMFKYNIAQSVIKQKDSVIKSRETLIKETSEKVKYRTNFKLILGTFLVGLVVGILLMVFRPWKRLI